MDIPLLRSSFDLVVEREPAVVARFYDILFTRYPQVRPLFRRNAPSACRRSTSPSSTCCTTGSRSRPRGRSCPALRGIGASATPRSSAPASTAGGGGDMGNDHDVIQFVQPGLHCRLIF